MIILWTALLFYGSSFSLQAQAVLPSGVIEKIIPSRNLCVGWNTTCLLVFPAAIQSADRGSADLLAERVKGAENALKVKAGRRDFAPTSLTVVTVDGQVFSFRVSYAGHPPYLVLDCRDGGSDKRLVRFKNASLSQAGLRRCAMQVRDADAFIKHVHTARYGLDFTLEGIYIKKEVLFLRFRLLNASNIPFQLGTLRFFMRDIITARRTAIQDNELTPLYMLATGEPEKADGQVIVMAIRRFTLADHKRVAIELTETEGDRAVNIWLKERNLRKTRKLDGQEGGIGKIE